MSTREAEGWWMKTATLGGGVSRSSGEPSGSGLLGASAKVHGSREGCGRCAATCRVGHGVVGWAWARSMTRAPGTAQAAWVSSLRHCTYGHRSGSQCWCVDQAPASPPDATCHMARFLFAPSSRPVATGVSGPGPAACEATLHSGVDCAPACAGRKREQITRYDPCGEKATPWTMSSGECPRMESTSRPLAVSITETSDPLGSSFESQLRTRASKRPSGL